MKRALVAIVVLATGCGSKDDTPSAGRAPAGHVVAAGVDDLDVTKPIVTQAMIDQYIAMQSDAENPFAVNGPHHDDMATRNAYAKAHGFTGNNQFEGFDLRLGLTEAAWFATANHMTEPASKLNDHDRKMFDARKAEIEAADKIARDRAMATHK